MYKCANIPLKFINFNLPFHLDIDTHVLTVVLIKQCLVHFPQSTKYTCFAGVVFACFHFCKLYQTLVIDRAFLIKSFHQVESNVMLKIKYTGFVFSSWICCVQCKLERLHYCCISVALCSNVNSGLT